MAIKENISDIRVTTEYGWMVSVRFQPWSDRVEVWIANRREGRGTDIYHFDERGNMIASELKEGVADPGPTMIINRFIWEGIKKSIQGIEELPDKKEVDAELKATKYHLEDLRKLVFKKNDNE